MVCGTHRSALCARRCQHVPRTVSVPADTSHVIVQIRLASFTLGQFRQHRVRWTRSGRQSLPYYALLYTSSAMFAVSGAVDDPTREARIALVSKLGPPPGYRLLRLVPAATASAPISSCGEALGGCSPPPASIRFALRSVQALGDAGDVLQLMHTAID